MSRWQVDAGSGDYVRVSNVGDRVFDKKDLRDLFGVSNEDILKWVYEGLPCIAYNTRWADSLTLNVRESQLAWFLGKYHPELIKR